MCLPFAQRQQVAAADDADYEYEYEYEYGCYRCIDMY